MKIFYIAFWLADSPSFTQFSFILIVYRLSLLPSSSAKMLGGAVVY
jgi:hypothetical protein